MEKNDSTNSLSLDDEDREYSLEDITEDASNFVIVQIRKYTSGDDEEDEYVEEIKEPATELDQAVTNFEELLDRVAKKQSSAAACVPQVLHHLSRLIRVLSRHRRALTQIGFDVYKFNSSVTELYTRYKKRLASGITTMALFVSFLEITENKYWTKNTTEQDQLSKAQRNEFFSLLKEKINGDVVEFNNITESALATQEEYSK